ncbi:serine hydrolase domain-containing protein [Dietzia cinnamea]|uniref:serine hydrolase domain-containing protein n=1 Tax=Dietzia cinnamea TaxID=321318 RepID=UPI00223BCC66|nr:serine hydrolase domain-containing protein [Dietzia cinnamea]MCT2061143.1 beta-lactamase family protein [Dietzia cinnamea]MCT2235438.1 beta-lactamase family protein [Dietzia cinnamea]MCT2300558.1 beta-lactamase family protein [Dietzia cinnamea]
MTPSPAPRRQTRPRLAAAAAIGAAVAVVLAACGVPLPDPVPGQSPAAYSGLEVSEDRIEYAIGKVTDIVEEELEASGVPGAAVAVVHNGEVALAEGFGVRSTETGESVDARTVFPLASISKPVSATVVAAESAGGRVGWDTPVREFLPWFALSDPRISDVVTVGDMFAHRSGLPEHAGDDLEDLGYERPAILHGLRHLPLEPFRASYAYTNFGLTAGAEAVAASARTPWAELGRERLFDPLGMSDSSFSYDELLDRDNRAIGHVRAPAAESGESSGEWIPADPARDPDAQAPAGGLSSSVTDMARWMSMVLDDGKGPGGAQVVPSEALRQALTPQSVSAPPRDAADRTGSYGYGFNIGTSSSGRVQWSHSGAFALGAGTAMLMMPSLDLGIITLTNAAPTGVAETINARFADYAQYGDPSLEWRELYTEQFGPLLDPVGDLVSTRQPSAPAPPRPAEELLGFYRNDYFGEIEVRPTVADESSDTEPSDTGSSDVGSPGAGSSGPELALAVGPGPLVWPLEHWDGDTFAVSPVGENWPRGSRGSVTFEGDTVTVELLDANGWGTFTRVDADEPAD